MMRERLACGCLAALLMGPGALPAQGQELARQPAALALLDAVRTALARNTSVQVSARQADAAAGRQQQAAGQFDTVLSSQLLRQRSYTPALAAQVAAGAASALQSDQLSSSVSAARLLRNGVQVTPSLSLERWSDPLAPTGTSVATRAALSVSVTIPLLKHAGRASTGAAELAATREAEASRHLLRHAMAQNTLEVVQAYWRYLAALRQWQIASDGVASSLRRAHDTAQLVQGEQLPAAENTLANADLAARRAAHLAAEQNLHDERAALGRLLGLSASATAALGLPGEDFPSPAQQPPATPLALLQETALAQRADLRANAAQAEGRQAELTALRRDLRPQLDLTLGAGVSGLKEGNTGAAAYLGASGSQLRGPNASIALSYQFPLQNRSASGQLIQKQAELDQLTLQGQDLRDHVTTQVATLQQAMPRLAAQLLETERMAQLYAAAVENEELRRQLGHGTLLDVLAIADRLLAARQAQTAAQLNYASTLAQLRFASATLLSSSGSGSSDDLTVSAATLRTQP